MHFLSVGVPLQLENNFLRVVLIQRVEDGLLLVFVEGVAEILSVDEKAFSFLHFCLPKYPQSDHVFLFQVFLLYFA